MNDKKVRGLSGATILTFVVFLFVMLWFTNQFDQKDEEITWKEFEKLATDEDVEKIVITQNKNVPTGRVELRFKVSVCVRRQCDPGIYEGKGS